MAEKQIGSPNDGPTSQDEFLDRPLPNSEASETASLAAIMLDNSLMAQAIDLLRPDDYYVPSRKKIFTAMMGLFERNEEINPITVGEELKKDGALQMAGGIMALTKLTDGHFHITNLSPLAKIIKGKSIKRQLIKAAAKITAECYEDEDDPESVLEHSQKAIFDISVDHTTKSFSLIEEIAEASLTKTYEIQQSGKAMVGVDTGFVDLNALTLGLRPGDLIILAGRPSSGKTALGVLIAMHAAIHSNPQVPTALFSLEMPEEQIAMRVLCAESRMDSMKYQSGYVTQQEWNKLTAAFHTLVGKKLQVDDTPRISVTQLKARTMRLASELSRSGSELGLVVVDYLQLMAGTKSYKNRLEEITQISADLKGVARELKVPMVVLSQLSRAPENRTDHRPILSDLRESGAIEQDADLVAFVYRGDMYKAKNEEHDNIAEIIVAKHRNGRTDTVYLRWDPTCARFDNLANDD